MSDSHLDEDTYQRIQDIVTYFSKQYKIKYSVRGIIDLLHRLGYTYKKPKTLSQ
ncbi:helix-turn-helix domain-containing protein [Candidatus Scalindua japonica]|uniref:helix-turn-helix domain-containing protein n=1 Tax=Candidatus Scalindua japonica TaxID=1284222 RepID=UPI0013A535CD